MGRQVVIRLAVLGGLLGCSTTDDGASVACVVDDAGTPCPEFTCENRQCGTDSSGRSCGTCPEGRACTAEGHCACADPRFAGPNCDRCVNQLFGGAACDRCLTPQEFEAGELPAGARLDQTEVTVAAYAECVAAGGCTPGGQAPDCNWGVAGREQHPINCVDWYQAEAYCLWSGARLPTRREWKWFATNHETTAEPWGDAEANCDLAVMDDGVTGCGLKSTWPVCSKPQGNTVDGHCDLVGNVWEWTATGNNETSPYPMCGIRRAYMGGSWFIDVSRLSVEAEYIDVTKLSLSQLGFRCLKE